MRSPPNSQMTQLVWEAKAIKGQSLRIERLERKKALGHQKAPQLGHKV